MISKKLCQYFLLLILPGYFQQAIAQSYADSLLNFITQNKDRAAVCIRANGSIIFRLNESKLMPLANTGNFLTAIEFAKQAGNGIINEDDYVPLSELEKYYIPATDSIQYNNWLISERSNNHIKEDSIQLVNIARGMTIYNCNANTEFLMDLLGMDNVKNNTTLFDLKDHTALFPVAASFFLYQNPGRAKEDKILKSIRELTEEQYCKTIYQIHNALKYDTLLKKKFREKDFSIKMQKLWSDRSAMSAAKEYVQLCSIINNRKYLNSVSYGVLAEILESRMEDTSNLKKYKHYGIIKGRTPFVITEALYTTLQNDDKIEAACFFSDLTFTENQSIKKWLDEFNTRLTDDPAFREQLAASSFNN